MCVPRPNHQKISWSFFLEEIQSCAKLLQFLLKVTPYLCWRHRKEHQYMWYLAVYSGEKWGDTENKGEMRRGSYFSRMLRNFTHTGDNLRKEFQHFEVNAKNYKIYKHIMYPYHLMPRWICARALHGSFQPMATPFLVLHCYSPALTSRGGAYLPLLFSQNSSHKVPFLPLSQ